MHAVLAAAAVLMCAGGADLAVDEQGVLRWADTGEEAALFGVNYYAPFCYDYQACKELGRDIRHVIDRDLEQFKRLRFDIIRMHVFDREISDLEGNLVENEHLELMDYLIARTSEEGILTVMTPIAWWWSPIRNEGFSTRFSMREMTTDPDAREAQRRYLRQFMNHVNPHTGHAIKDDPGIAAVELINEPQYPGGATDEAVVEYIHALAEAVRQTGCDKPLFYNGWGNRYGAVGAADMLAGSSFNWYPTDLLSGRRLEANFLPRVNVHGAMEHPALSDKAKIVYEFDAADILEGYIYPAMARSFRRGGAQIAAQFQYDATPTAQFNCNWPTHYLNLLYTPGKALGMLIAGEAFRRLPRGADYGAYPESNRFGPFRVSYEEGLAELAAQKVFYHSAPTGAVPPSPETLERVAGVGPSPILDYPGTGAYFLDRLEPGLWRLQVYPDVVYVADPFQRYARLGEDVARLVWRPHAMTVRLPGLGAAPACYGPDGQRLASAGRRLELPGPGEYLLSRRALDADQVETALACDDAPAFWAPPADDGPLRLHHRPPRRVQHGEALRLTAQAHPVPEGATVWLHIEGNGTTHHIPMRETAPETYAAEAPRELLPPGAYRYAMAVHREAGATVFPLATPVEAGPDELRLFQRARQVVFPAEAATGPLSTDLSAPPPAGVDVSPTDTGGFRIAVDSLGDDGVVKATWPAASFDAPAPLRRDGAGMLAVRCRRLAPATTLFQLALVEEDGAAFGLNLDAPHAWRTLRVRPPLLQSLWETDRWPLNPGQVERAAAALGAWLYPGGQDGPHAFEVAGIAWEPGQSYWELEVVEPGPPVRAHQGGWYPVRTHWSWPTRALVVDGRVPGRYADRIATRGFPPGEGSAGILSYVPAYVTERREALAETSEAVVWVRGGPYTTRAELVFSELDGSPWGTNIDLSTAWRPIRVPFDSLTLFRHWERVPDRRGGQGDGFQPENVAQVHISFGPWLLGEDAGKPQSLELDSVVFTADGSE